MRKEKQLLLDEIKQHLSGSPSFVITRYQEIDPNKSSSLRKSILEKGGLFQVVKKRLFLKAATQTDCKLSEISLEGHIGIVYTGEDSVGTTKAIYDFKKEHGEALEVLGGLFQGKVCSPEEFKQIAELPSLSEMRSQMVGVLQAPLSNLLSMLEAVPAAVVSCIDQKAVQQ